MYGFFKSASDDIMDIIDCKEINTQLEKKYNLKFDKLEIKLKKIIKCKSNFSELTEELDLTDKDLLYLLVKTYPNMFNHRLIKFIRKTYLFPDEDI